MNLQKPQQVNHLQESHLPKTSIDESYFTMHVHAEHVHAKHVRAESIYTQQFVCEQCGQKNSFIYKVNSSYSQIQEQTHCKSCHFKSHFKKFILQ